MLINIKEIPPGHSVIEQNVIMTDEQIQDGGFAGSVFCHAEIDSVQFQICIRLSYSCKVNQECSRCLEHFEYPVRGTFDVIMQHKNAPGLTRENENDFDCFFSDHDTEIDLRQSIYEEVMINVPIKPLCTIECPGITGYTGTDREDLKHKDTIDPRWNALKKLKKKMQKDK